MASRAAIFRRDTVRRASRSIPPLRAPVVDVGADASVLNRVPFTRTALVDGAISSQAWTIVSGPTGVGSTIDNDADLVYIPTIPGTYVLRYTASNPVASGFDELTLTVVPVVVPMSATAVARGTMPGVAINRVPRLEATGAATASSDGTLRRVVRPESQPAAADATATGEAIAARPIAGTATAQAFALAQTIARIRALAGQATATAYVVRAELSPTVPGFALARSTATGTLRRVQPANGAAFASSSAEGEQHRTILYSEIVTAETAANGATRYVVIVSGSVSAESTAQGTQHPVPAMYGIATAHARVDLAIQRRAANLLNALAQANATAGERPGRLVETTAQAYAYAQVIAQRSVNVVRGFITALSEARGDLVLGPVRHIARVTATARGDLRPVRGIRETLIAESSVDDTTLRAAYEMSSVVREITVEESETMNAYELRTDGSDVPFSDDDEIPEFERIFLDYRS